MNIFVLDLDPVVAATMQCDKHVVKMIVESAQIMSTIVGGPYKPTHKNHPCVKWAASGMKNYSWLAKHGMSLCDEYTRRYHRIHKSEAIIILLRNEISRMHVPNISTPFVQCMPDEYKNDDVVKAYRDYYKTKARFAKWNYSNAPYWWNVN